MGNNKPSQANQGYYCYITEANRAKPTSSNKFCQIAKSFKEVRTFD